MAMLQSSQLNNKQYLAIKRKIIYLNIYTNECLTAKAVDPIEESMQ